MVRKPKRPTRRAVWCARVNLANFTDPEWVRSAGWPPDHVERTIRESRATLAAEEAYAPHDEATALPAHGPETPERAALRRILELAEAIDEAGDGGDENDEIMHICSGMLGE